MFQLCKTIEDLHVKRLLHQDIKADNFFLTVVNDDCHPMLIDFGKAIHLSDAPSKRKVLNPVEREKYRKKASTHSTRSNIALGQPSY